MPRRTHRKSRAGCTQCKRRHVKCDETRPKCVNCVTAGLRCPYENEALKASSPGSHTVSQAATPSPKNVAGTDTSSEAPGLESPGIENAPRGSINMLHMELILHWTHDTHRTFSVSDSQEYVYGQITSQVAMKNPFLMLQVLALSALHLSILHPDKRQYYHDHSTRLQAEALEGFNAIIHDISASSVVPAFLFSVLVGVHVFCATFAFRGNDFNEVLESLSSCINLLRGVRSIIGGRWEVLQNSELRPILITAHDIHAAVSGKSGDLNPLRELISSADIGETSREAYQHAIDEMERIYLIQHITVGEDSRQRTNMVFGWFVQVRKEYVDLLMQRRPEALVILAYYAAILHLRRDFWAIGDSGRYLIATISTYLGKHWEDSLSWPNLIVTTGSLP